MAIVGLRLGECVGIELGSEDMVGFRLGEADGSDEGLSF
jgi:hypothetical protein